MLQMTELLIHSDDVPMAARIALTNAAATPGEQRVSFLLEAARILHQDIGLACEDACELVGLADCGSCDESSVS